MRCSHYHAAAFIVALLTFVAPCAMADEPPADLVNPQIEVDYVKPDAQNHPEFAAIYERLKERKALEQFRQFLAPLKFNPGQKLILRLDQCGGRYAQYTRQTPAVATICYEFVEELERIAPTAAIQLVQTQGHPFVRPDAARVGPFALEVLHQVALATFDMLDLPVWGRKQDAADRVAALVMLQFSKFNMAWTAVVGTAWFLAGETVETQDLSDVRGVMAQRYYTTLCIAVGADKKTFGSFVHEWRGGAYPAAGDLPISRAAGCADEYDTLKHAVQVLLGAHIDDALLKRVQNVKWF